MNLIIHRGTHQIGGSCIELYTENTRIILDIGQELPNIDEEKLNKISELPKVKGLYKDDIKSIDAILVSHGHGDHIGLINEINAQVPIFIGEKALKIFNVTAQFIGDKPVVNLVKYFISGQEMTIGDFFVTPYLVDHSGFDAYAFIIKADNKCIVYTGDLRDHGKKKKATDYFKYNIPIGADALLIEGTMMSRIGENVETEEMIEKKAYEFMKSKATPVFVLQSSTNIDRLVGMYNAAKQSGRIFVMDIFTAHIVAKLGRSIPKPGQFKEDKDMRGLDINKLLFQSLKQEGDLARFIEEIKNSPQDYFLGIRDEYINIYYMGGSLLKISCNGENKDKSFKFKCEFNEKYFVNSNELVPKADDTIGWFDKLEILKTYIKKYQEGITASGHVKNEKMAQQIILNNINSSPNSDYFITDMEYSCPGIGYGRFDYVAITKEKDSKGKHRLVLIELKYGTGAFGTSFSEKNGKINYGGGIVGHALNFSRFVYGVKEQNSFKRAKINKTSYDTLSFLSKETIDSLANKFQLGLLNSEIGNIFGKLEENDIDTDENNVETLLICVACTNEESAKNTLKKYLGSSEGKDAEYNVKLLKNNGEIDNRFNMKCLVTSQKELEYLKHDQFIDL